MMKSIWSMRANERRREEMLRKLRAAANESRTAIYEGGIEHIHVKETLHNGFPAHYGENAPLCSEVFADANITTVRPYFTSSPNLCVACIYRIKDSMAVRA